MKKKTAAADVAATAMKGKVWMPKKCLESFYTIEKECKALTEEIRLLEMEFNTLKAENDGGGSS